MSFHEISQEQPIDPIDVINDFDRSSSTLISVSDRLCRYPNSIDLSVFAAEYHNCMVKMGIMSANRFFNHNRLAAIVTTETVVNAINILDGRLHRLLPERPLERIDPEYQTAMQSIISGDRSFDEPEQYDLVMPCETTDEPLTADQGISILSLKYGTVLSEYRSAVFNQSPVREFRDGLANQAAAERTRDKAILAIGGGLLVAAAGALISRRFNRQQ